MGDPGPGGRSLPGRSDRMMEDNPMTRTPTYAAIEVALKSLAVHAANVRARSAEACSETSSSIRFFRQLGVRSSRTPRRCV